MPIAPIVHYMILCDDWSLDGPNNRRLTIHGLIWNIRSLEEPPFPLLHQGFCVFLALAAGRGDGEGQIVCVYEETGQKIFETRKRPVPFSADPLEVVGVPFRIRDCIFPQAGRYTVQFWYDGVMLERAPVELEVIMANQSNEGFHLLDDFVCEAIHAPSVPRPVRIRGGMTEGISFIADGDDELVRATVRQLASLIAKSSDPTGAIAFCQTLLLEQVDKITKNGQAGPIQ